MKQAIVFLVAFSAAAQTPDADVAKGFENLSTAYSIAQVLDTWRAFGRIPQLEEIRDPWGTPYRVENSATSYRIIGAGSDRKFDETTWTPAAQFGGIEGDVVLENGKLIRSNRNWLVAHMSAGGAAATQLGILQVAEMTFMRMRTPGMQKLTGIRLTTMSMEKVGALVEKERKDNGGLARLAPPADALDTLLFSSSPDGANARLTRDVWGTFYKLVIDGDRYRLISAGADRQFDPTSWTRPAAADAAEDIIYENGAFTRRPDEKELLSKSDLTVVPIAQPPDASMAGGSPFLAVGADVKAPVVLHRVEPVYPEEYRLARISGIVIVQTAITENGTVEDVRLLRSVAPEMDMAAMDAVRQWTFQPGTINGKPAPVLFVLTINFLLK
jgi:TonB family protein